MLEIAPKMMITRWMSAAVAAACLLFASAALADDLFDANELLEMELVGPVHTLVKNMRKEKAYPFTLRTEGREYRVMLSPRGKSRLEICKFPPLRVTFASTDAGNSLVPGWDELKLVTHCREVQNMQVNVLEEYVAYQLFALLSDTSYRTRLLKITYTDTDGRENMTHYAFALEPTDHLATRVGGVKASLPAVSLSKLDHRQLALMFMFQYLIGNTDWSIVAAFGKRNCCHNGKLVDVDSELFYVPYDFDRCGLVDASYAYADPSFKLRSVTQRLYRGFCIDPQEIVAAIDTTFELRPEMLKIAREVPLLDAKDRKKMETYIEKYFDKVEDRDKFLKYVRRRCLTR